MNVPGFVISSLSTSRKKDGPDDYTVLLNITGEFHSPKDADLSAIFAAQKQNASLTLGNIEAPIHLSTGMCKSTRK